MAKGGHNLELSGQVFDISGELVREEKKRRELADERVYICVMGSLSSVDIEIEVENNAHLLKCHTNTQYLSMSIALILVFNVFKYQPQTTVIFRSC